MAKLRGFNPFSSEYNCLDPQIIVNPRFAELVYQFGNYTLRGEFIHRKLHSSQVESFKKNNWSANRMGINIDNYKDCYVTDLSSGEIYPMYFVVPCGHCCICRNTKEANVVRRMQYEAMLYDSDPIHITLTYDNDHLPADMSVNMRHVQLFKKNVRTMLERSNYGEFRDGKWWFPNLRWVDGAEYGHKGTCRPHYHLILYNYKQIGRFDIRFLHNICWHAWSSEVEVPVFCHPFDKSPSYEVKKIKVRTPNCRWRLLTVMPITLDYVPKGCNKSLRDMGKTVMQAFGYVSKYFFKEDDSDVPPGRAPLFHTFSKTKGLGGIGAPFIDRHAKELRSAFFREYFFLDRDGKLFKMPYDRYLLNRVFPSRYSSVMYRYREKFRFLYRHVDMLRPDQRVKYDELKIIYGSLFPVLEVYGDNSHCYKAGVCCDLVNSFLVQHVADKFIPGLIEYFGNLDIGNVLELERKRHVLLSRLFIVPKVRNVYADSLKFLKYRRRRKEEFIQL